MAGRLAVLALTALVVTLILLVGLWFAYAVAAGDVSLPYPFNFVGGVVIVATACLGAVRATSHLLDGHASA